MMTYKLFVDVDFNCTNPYSVRIYRVTGDAVDYICAEFFATLADCEKYVKELPIG